MNKVYYIGGSPCSGKSTVAQMLADEYGFYYFKLDDYLNKYLELAKSQRAPYSLKVGNMSTDEMWLRNPQELNVEELAIYKEFFQYAQEDIQNLECNTPIVAEGAGFLPKLMMEAGIGTDSYICIVPTKEFQFRKYREREWIGDVLKDSSNKEQAFMNWMERDALFAEAVRTDARKLGFKTILVDGSTTVTENLEIVKKYLALFSLN